MTTQQVASTPCREPLPEEDHERLRSLVEVEHTVRIGVECVEITPRLLHMVFGDGLALWGIEPFVTAPDYYVVRGDSHWYTDGDFDDSAPEEFVHILDAMSDILTEIGGQFGDENDHEWRENDPDWPVLIASPGYRWFELKFPAGWNTPASGDSK
jgi:hypothetical protein